MVLELRASGVGGGGVRARPVAQGGLVRGEVGAVADVAKGGRADAAVESAEAVMSPDMQDDVAVAEGSRGMSCAYERLLVDLDELCWSRN